MNGNVTRHAQPGFMQKPEHLVHSHSMGVVMGDHHGSHMMREELIG